jgi:putative MATE family efflux protein
MALSTETPRPAFGLRRQLVLLAIPAALQLLLRNAYGLNDLYWVKALGREAQSAVSLAVMVQILLSALFEGLGLGLLSLSGRVHGAGESHRARKILGIALVAALALSALIAMLGLSTIEHYVRFLVAIPADGSGDVASLALERESLERYLEPLFAGAFFLCLATIVDSSFVAKRNTTAPFFLQGLAIGLNLLLNPLLIFGFGPIPALGVAGAGIATVMSRASSSLLGLFLLLRSLPRSGPPEARSGLELARKMLRVGAPVSAAIATYSLCYQVIFATTFSQFGAVGRAAFGAGFRIEGLAFCTIWGLAVSSGSLVSNALGARDPDFAEATIRFSIKTVLWITLPLGLMFYFVPEPFAALLAADGAVRDETILYLQIIAFSQFAVGLQGVYDQSLSAAGYTLPVFLSTSFWNLSRIPLCKWLALDAGYGLAGIWWAINISSYGKGLCSWLLFRAGHWKKVEL